MRKKSFNRALGEVNPLALVVLGSLLLLLSNFIGSKVLAFCSLAVIMIGVFLLSNLKQKIIRKRNPRKFVRKVLNWQRNSSPTRYYSDRYRTANRQRTNRAREPVFFTLDGPEYDRPRSKRVMCRGARTVPKEYSYFQLVDHGSVYDMVDFEDVEHLVKDEKFRLWKGNTINYFLGDQVEYSELFTKVNGYLIPRNYVIGAFRIQDGLGINLVLFNGEKITLHLKSEPPDAEFNTVMQALGEIYPEMEYLGENGADWYRNNVLKLADCAIRESQMVEYDGIDRIIEGFDTDCNWSNKRTKRRRMNTNNTINECNSF